MILCVSVFIPGTNFLLFFRYTEKEEKELKRY